MSLKINDDWIPTINIIPPAKPASFPARAERAKIGKMLRETISRESHSLLNTGFTRDPLAILSATDRSRIPELLPIRYERMAVSPFTFLRGAAAVMASDLAQLPRLGIPVQACGDCHLMNFGAFDTPEGKVLFDINDFDETLPGVDFTVDLKRLTASVAVAALDAGWSDKKAKEAVRSVARNYREFMLELAKLGPLETWHLSMDVHQEASRISNTKLRNHILNTLTKALKNLSQDDNFPKLAEVKDGIARIADHPPLIYHLKQKDDPRHKMDITTGFAAYEQALPSEVRMLLQRFHLADVAFKVVGVGSVGTFCAVGLLVSADSEPLFLQIKEALVSNISGLTDGSKGALHQGQRVVEGQRMMQAASDTFLGWTQDKEAGRYFYIRHLKNRTLGAIDEMMEGEALFQYGALCARTLARAHARTGDATMMAGYMGKSEALDIALADFAMGYAAQTKLDHAQLVNSVLSDKPKKSPICP